MYVNETAMHVEAWIMSNNIPQSFSLGMLTKTHSNYADLFTSLPTPQAPNQDHNMNFQSKAMTLKDLSIHENAIEDTTSHISQCNNAEGDFRLVTVSVAVCVLPPLPRPTDGGSWGGGHRKDVYVCMYIYIYVCIYR